MGWYEEFQKTIGEAARQIKGSGHPVHTTASPRNGKVFFTNNFQEKAKQWGLSEKDALDVFHHGEEDQPGMKTGKYNGYEHCIYYGQRKTTGQPYISTIWKRGRR